MTPSENMSRHSPVSVPFASCNPWTAGSTGGSVGCLAASGGIVGNRLAPSGSIGRGVGRTRGGGVTSACDFMRGGGVTSAAKRRGAGVPTGGVGTSAGDNCGFGVTVSADGFGFQTWRWIGSLPGGSVVVTPTFICKPLLPK